MKIGLNLLLWTGVATEEHLPVLDRIKGWGYDGVEMPLMDPAGTPWKQYNQAMKDLDLGCTACTVVAEPADPTSADPKARAAAADALKACVDACVEMGAEVLVGPLHAALGKTTGKPRTEDEWKRSVDTLREVGEYAADADVDLAVEFLNRFETYFLNCAADTAAYCKAIGLPNVGVHYDTFHSNIEENDVGEAIRSTADCLRHVHISENNRGVPGRGLVRWDETFAALKEVGYDRWLTTEAFGGAIPEIAAAACIWRDLFDSVEALAVENIRFVREKWGAA